MLPGLEVATAIASSESELAAERPDMQETNQGIKNLNTLWTAVTPIIVSNVISRENRRNENEIRTIFRKASVSYVRDDEMQDKQVRYVCPICVLEGKNHKHRLCTLA